MVRHEDEMRIEYKEQMRGGTGTTELLHMEEATNMKNARLLAKISLPPGASIGEHAHENETEYYLILSGQGIVVDNGVYREVGPGDVVITGGGASHSIRNSADVPLVFHAVIVTY